MAYLSLFVVYLFIIDCCTEGKLVTQWTKISVTGWQVFVTGWHLCHPVVVSKDALQYCTLLLRTLIRSGVSSLSYLTEPLSDVALSLLCIVFVGFIIWFWFWFDRSCNQGLSRPCDVHGPRPISTHVRHYIDIRAAGALQGGRWSHDGFLTRDTAVNYGPPVGGTVSRRSVHSGGRRGLASFPVKRAIFPICVSWLFVCVQHYSFTGFMLTPIRGDTKNLLKDGKTILHCDIFLPGTSASI